MSDISENEDDQNQPTLPPRQIDSGVQDDATIPPIGDDATIPPDGLQSDEAATIPPVAPTDDLDTLPQSETAWRPGGRIRYFGDYELIDEIARGGMGVVYRAKQTSLNRVVALKMILAGQLAGEEEVQRFHAEAEAAANLDHPGIVPIYEVGEVEGQHYFSMGYVDGCSLSDLIAENPLEAKEAAQLTLKVAQAVQYAHEQGVIHRDLKPANVLVAARGEGEGSSLAVASGSKLEKSSSSKSNVTPWTPKVTDFGLAKQVQGDDNLTASGQILGTPNYMPPEQASGKIEEIDHRSDIYSLGGILYALITGRPPFQAANQLDTLMQVLEKEPVPPRQLDSKLPRDIETIALKALEKDPRRRYQSSLEMAEDLQRFMNEEPILARSITPIERAWRWTKRKPVVAGLGALAATLLLVVSIGGPLAAIQQSKLRVIAVDNANSAKRAQKAAELATDAEAAAKQDALDANEALNQEKERVEQTAYARSISLAHREWLDGNPARTKRLLAECPIDKRGWEWDYLDGLTRAEDKVIFAHGIPAGIALSPTGKTLLTRGKRDQKLIFWAADSGLEMDSTRIPNLMNAQFMSETHVLVTAGDSVVYAQAMDEQGQSNPKIIRQFGQFGSAALSCRLVSETNELSAAFGDGSVIVYDLDSGQELRRMPQKRQTEFAHVFSPDAKLVVGVRDNIVRVWEVATGEEQFEIAGHVGRADAIAFSPDGKMLASGGRGGEVFLTDAEAGTRIREFHFHESGITSLDFSHDGSRIISGSHDRTARVFNVNNGNELLAIRGHEQAINDVAFHPDGQRVATSSNDGSVRIWTIDGQLAVSDQVRIKLQGASHMGHKIGLESRVLYGQTGMVYDVRVSPNTNLVATTATGTDQGDNQIRVWSLDDATLHAGFPVPGGLLHTLEFTADSKHLIVGSGGAGDKLAPGSIAIWDLETKEKLRTIEYGSCMFIRPVLNAKNDILAVLTGNLKYGHVRFYSFPECKLLHEQEILDQRLSGIAFSPQDDTLVTSTAPGGLIQIWNARTGKEIDSFVAHGAGVFAVAANRNGEIATANMDGTIGIWNLQSKTLVGELKGHNAYVVGICFSPDGKRLLSSSEDEAVKVWDLKSFSELLTFKDHRSPALKADWSEDGTTLATTSRDGTLIVRELRRDNDTSGDAPWVTIFEDDFERSEVGDRWTATAPNAWKIENGRLVGTQKSTAMPGTTFPAAFIALSTLDIPKTVEIEADVLIRQPMLAQFVLANYRTNQYIAPYIASTTQPYGFVGSAIQVAKGAGEQTKILNRQQGTRLQTGKNHRMKIRREGDNLEFYLDDQLLSKTRVPALESNLLSLSGCWSKIGDQIEFDNVVVRIPKTLVRNIEVRGMVNEWLTDYLIPQLVEERIRSAFPDGSDDQQVALSFLRGLNANDSFTGNDVIAAIEKVVNRPDASEEQYETAAKQADIYLSVNPDDWWQWSKFSLAYTRSGDFEKAIKLLDKTDARCIEQEGHRYPLALAARALTLHAMNQPEQSRKAHEHLDDFMINKWKPVGLADLKKEIESKIPLQRNELRDQLLEQIRVSREAFFMEQNAQKELADFADDAVITYGRARRADQYDLQYDRDEYLKLESIKSVSAPLPNVQLLIDQVEFKQDGDRAVLAIVQEMKFIKPDLTTASLFRFGIGYQFEKRDDNWLVTRHRIWQIDRKFGDTWHRWNADHWKQLDQRIEALKQNDGDLLELARVCKDAGRTPEAFKVAQSVLDDDSRSSLDRASALALAGECLIGLAQFEEGIEVLEKARQTDPTVQMPWFLTRQKQAMAFKKTPFSMTYSPETNRMATSHDGGQVIVSDLESMEQLKAFDAHLNIAADLAFFDQGRKLVSAGFDRAVNVFDVNEGTREKQYATHLSVIFRLESHPTKPEIVITSSGDSTAKVWDMVAERELFALSGHSGHVMTAAFSPDGKQIATGSRDETIRIWDAEKGRQTHQFKAHDHGVWRVDWTPDGERLVSVGKDNMVRVWATDSWKEIASLPGHQTDIEAVRVSADGKIAASADLDGVIYVWDLQTLKPLTVLRTQTSAIYDLQFYDGDLFSSGADGTVRRWDVDFSRSPLSQALEATTK